MHILVIGAARFACIYGLTEPLPVGDDVPILVPRAADSGLVRPDACVRLELVAGRA